ncbi:MAG: hypothetical protein ABL888_20755 [Pirellulaceae bacterium]
MNKKRTRNSGEKIEKKLSEVRDADAVLAVVIVLKKITFNMEKKKLGR